MNRWIRASNSMVSPSILNSAITPCSSSPIYHLSRFLSTSTPHAHSTPSSHSSGSSAADLPVGWFLGVKPGDNPEVLPGGGSRLQARYFMGLMTISAFFMAYASLAPPETDPLVWHKEYVLNKEKFKAPAKADFP